MMYLGVLLATLSGVFLWKQPLIWRLLGFAPAQHP